MDRDDENKFRETLKDLVENRPETLDIFKGFEGKAYADFSRTNAAPAKKRKVRTVYKIVAAAAAFLLVFAAFLAPELRPKENTADEPNPVIVPIETHEELASGSYATVYDRFRSYAGQDDKTNLNLRQMLGIDPIPDIAYDNSSISVMPLDAGAGNDTASIGAAKNDSAQSTGDAVLAPQESGITWIDDKIIDDAPPDAGSIPDTGDGSNTGNVPDSDHPTDTDPTEDIVPPMDIAPILPEDSAAEDGNAAETGADSPKEDPADLVHSETNNQVKGVMEADIVKTDGKYIYAVNSEYLYILLANHGNPKIISKIPQDSGISGLYFEMYITEGKLIAIRNERNIPDEAREEYLKQYGEDEDAIDIPERSRERINYPGLLVRSDCVVDIFDLSDPENPVKAGTLSQSGSYSDSRMVGNILYLISNFSDIDFNALVEDVPESYVPLFTEGENQIACAPADIIIPPNSQAMSYTVIGGFDTAGSGKYISSKSLLNQNENVYATENSIYITSYADDKKTSTDDDVSTFVPATRQTLFTRLSVNEGMVEVQASETLPGAVLNQFSLDEFKGILRVVMSSDTFRDQYTSLITLDGNLKVIGSIDRIAPDEVVKSCRFLGDTAYFVTFRNTDPLFSVDLSDPANPKILGELKIPGFSEYLHPYTNGLLFGLGRDADPESGTVRGLKLSMFDNSNPADVKEMHTLILDDYDYSEAESNHKAILVDAAKNLIAFPTSGKYMIYSYDASVGFTKVSEVSLPGSKDLYRLANGIRGLFIGEYFYVASPNTVLSFDMNNHFAKTGGTGLSQTAYAVSQNRYNILPLRTGVIVPEGLND